MGVAPTQFITRRPRKRGGGFRGHAPRWANRVSIRRLIWPMPIPKSRGSSAGPRLELRMGERDAESELHAPPDKGGT